MRHRLSLRVLLVLVATALVLVPAGVAAAGPAAENPLTKAQHAFDKIQAQAANAATLYQSALTEQSRLADEITRLQLEIPALRARADELRAQVEKRSAALYRASTRRWPFPPVRPSARSTPLAKPISARQRLRTTSSSRPTFAALPTSSPPRRSS